LLSKKREGREEELELREKSDGRTHVPMSGADVRKKIKKHFLGKGGEETRKSGIRASRRRQQRKKGGAAGTSFSKWKKAWGA